MVEKKIQLCLTSYSISFIDPFSLKEIHYSIEKEW